MLRILAQFGRRSNGLQILQIFCSAVVGCSGKDATPRVIRAHTTIIDGISHAEPAALAERACQSCHGVGLSGGPRGEPSCYQCHGRTWQEIDGQVSRAPADHTELKQRDVAGVALMFHHRPGLTTPIGTCNGCHGPQLEGTGRVGLPGCELCHAKVWE